MERGGKTRDQRERRLVATSLSEDYRCGFVGFIRGLNGFKRWGRISDSARKSVGANDCTSTEIILY